MLELDSTVYDDQYQSTDSGVATLSCTDSSTASSDASDPGSPYSPPSIGDTELPNAISTPCKPITIAPKMPPLASITQPTSTTVTTTNRCQQNQPHQWPWNSTTATNTVETNKGSISSTNINNNNTNINNNKLKRPSTDKSDAVNNKKSRSTNTDKAQQTSGLGKKPPTPLIAKNSKITEDANAKITGYFKTQTKSSTLKKDISNIVMQSASLSSIPPLTEISPKPKGSESLKKYFNLLTQQANEKALKSEFEVRPVTTLPTLASAAQKKVERKTAKVSPMVSNVKKTQKFAAISPKKPVMIAPRITKPAAPNPLAAKKLPAGGKFLEQMKQLPPPPTVVLTAIRIPPAQAPPPLQPTSQTMSPPKAQAKVGPVFSMMPNLVQIPNLVPTTAKTQSLVMNNGIAAARINAAAQLLMNGAVIKLQQMQNGDVSVAAPMSGTTSTTVSTHSQLRSLHKQQQIPTAYTTQQLTPQLFMTTSGSGIYYNAPLPIHTYAGMQSIPALQPIQSQPLPSINTILPSHHQTNKQALPTYTSTAQQTAPPPSTLNIPTPIPRPSIIPKPMSAPVTTTASIGSQTTSSLICKPKTLPPPPPLPVLLSEPPKLVPVSLKVNTALPVTVPVVPVELPVTPTVIDLCSPTLPQLSPRLKVPPSPTSPKSLVLERIKLKKPTESELKVDLSISLETPPAPKESMLPPPLTPSLPERSKSPILSQPKVIRFPVQQRNAMRIGVKGTRRSDGRYDGVCYWDGCNEKFDNNSQLLDHLQTQHVNPQTGPFSCLWSGCKVHGHKSCSRTWLERHVLSHGGNRTYKCIVDGCGQRFPSQLALQKHVNNHFTNTENNKGNNKPEQVTAKLVKKNGKKLRYRRQAWSARRFDYFDIGMMEGLQHRLMLAGALASGPRGSVTFKGRPLARRTGKYGSEALIKWFPTNIIADEWTPLTDKLPEKHLEIKTMSLHERIELQKFLRHVYKLNKHKLSMELESSSMSSSTSEISSSSSLSTCSSLDAPAFKQHVINAMSDNDNDYYHHHHNHSLLSSSTSSSTSLNALNNIRRITKKYRKPPRTMPS